MIETRTQKQYRTVCDDCNESLGFQNADPDWVLSRERALDMAHAHGWVTDDDGRLVCPKCKKKKAETE